jgi:hypothetical protein
LFKDYALLLSEEFWRFFHGRVAFVSVSSLLSMCLSPIGADYRIMQIIVYFTVTVSSPVPFRGYLLHARRLSQSNVVGQFVVYPTIPDTVVSVSEVVDKKQLSDDQKPSTSTTSGLRTAIEYIANLVILTFILCLVIANSHRYWTRRMSVCGGLLTDDCSLPVTLSLRA